MICRAMLRLADAAPDFALPLQHISESLHFDATLMPPHTPPLFRRRLSLLIIAPIFTADAHLRH